MNAESRAPIATTIPPTVYRVAVSAALVLALSAGAAFAHVQLDAPNGGETLEAGSVFTVRWQDVIPHGPADHAPIEAAWAYVWTSTSGGAFTCYGSVLDELTSDPTTVLPR